jgi:hypothetical protein
LVGLRIRDFELSIIAYEIDIDGRLIFDKHGWREFHRDEDDLQVGEALLITARTTRRNLSMVFVIDII